ncbi:MAG: DUF349 domain-containing protein [Bacteroidales bacterium]
MENKENLDPRNTRTEVPEGEESRPSDTSADLTQSENTESAESPEKEVQEPAAEEKSQADPEPAAEEKPEAVEPAAEEKSQADPEPTAEEKSQADPEPAAKEKSQADPEPTAKEEVVTGEAEEDNDTLAARYNAMDRPALTDMIEQLVQSDDINHIRRHIGFLKAAYRKQLRDENMVAYEKGMDKEDAEGHAAEKQIDPQTERFNAAFSVYKEKKALYDQALEKEMQENLQVKEHILDELRTLIDSEEELKRTYDHFHELQDRWRSAGPVPRSAKGTLWNNYHFLVEKFFDKVNINKELKDLDLKKNLEVKTGLCEKAEELLLESSITKSFQQLQKLHEAWKETGPVPKDKKDEIWDRFKAATDKLNKRRQEHYEKLKEEQNKNYAAKLVLCEKAEQLSAHLPETPRQWQEKTEEINELFKFWKTIGFAPKKVNNEIWNRFRTALDTFFSAKKEFFRRFKDQQKDNYNQKLNLCLQAEALKDSEDWKATTEELIRLQKEWKKVGPVPAKFSDKIWKRFRKACDHFFNRKSEHFANIGEKQDENLKNKQELIEKVKNHSYSDDNKENLETLKEFQRQWMAIGHVPIKQKDKIQGEFRKAVDHQFDVLNISKKAKSTLGFRTKIENLKNAPNADNVIYKERNYLAGKIKSLESDIQVLENNIGFFASSKKADVLKAEFEEKIEKARNEIDVLKEKMKILRDA